MEIYRIHGDNIVECERIVDFILRNVQIMKSSRSFSSPSCPNIEITFSYLSNIYEWNIELFPGLCKNNRKRWSSDIFDALKLNGGFLNETPDAIVTKVNKEQEKLLFAVEFCSALQAGNQAWQRSGRAYSVGRTGCPYLYIVDFVKYELDTETRKRKNLRFPNPAIPYSFINFSRNDNIFTAQAYIKSEEFQPEYDANLLNFDISIFAENDISNFMLHKMIDLDTQAIEKCLLNKNMQMVMFLSQKMSSSSQFNTADWVDIYRESIPIEEYSQKIKKLKFKKIIAEKSTHGKVLSFLKIVQEFGVGIISEDLPFGIIPAKKRAIVANKIFEIFKLDRNTVKSLASNQKDLIICMIKGFKPRGDDNRPDRGILPLIAMLTNENVEIFTFLYGPIISKHYELLISDSIKLANLNGLWKSLLSLTNYLLIDSVILGKNNTIAEQLFDNYEVKKHFLERKSDNSFVISEINKYPNSYHEDDVDTLIHAIFKYFMNDICHEGLCNPPGGDWSGISIVYKNTLYKWLSLPRVSETGKRPDHVLELFIGEKPFLLLIESKENKSDLEYNVGDGLKNYIRYLMNFSPSVMLCNDGWKLCDNSVCYFDFNVISVGAYISKEKRKTQFLDMTNCDILFEFSHNIPESFWELDIISQKPLANEISNILKTLISKNVPNYIVKIKN